MAIADFIPRRAGNSIEAMPEPQPQPSQNVPAADRAAASPPAASAGPSAAPSAAPDAPTRKPIPAKNEPATIAANYYVEEAADRRTYYQDYQRKAVAFTATETRVTSAREDLRTVRDMVEVAQARGWRSVQLRGTETFRREAWIEAAAAGLDAAGYKASDPDRQEADRRKGEREPSRPANAIAPAVPGASERSTPAAAVAAIAASGPVAAVVTAGRNGSVRDASNRPAATDGPSPSVAIATSAPATPATPAEQRKALRTAEAELSSDGKLILAALSEKIDRQMNRYNSDAKAELKLFVATELQAKERSQGPVQLSAEQRRMASAPEQGRAAGTGNVETLREGRDAGRSSASAPPPNLSREPEQPRLTRSR